MDAILNNPFRILGLEPTNDETIISERVSEILRLLTNGEEVSFPIDEFYNHILVDPYNTQHYNSLSTNIGKPIPTRNIETVKIAHEKLKDPIKRKYYALFSFNQDQIDNNLFNIDQLAEYLENDLNLKEGRINRRWNLLNTILLNDFKEENNPNYTVEKEYDKLTIKNQIEDENWIKPNSTYTFNEDCNYSYEYSCEWVEGVDNKKFSFFWGKEFLKNNYYSFGIMGEGYYYLAKTVNGISTSIENDSDLFLWKYSDIICKNGKNQIEIRRNHNCLEFYINKELIHKTSQYSQFYGNEYGFSVCGKQTVIFSNLRVNRYKEDIDYASDLTISASNFENVKSLALLFFFKTYLSFNQPLTYASSKSDIKNEGYAPSNLRLSLDKVLILFGKLFKKEVLFSIGFLQEGAETENCWKDIAQWFFDDLGIFLELAFDKHKNIKDNGIHFKERFQDTTLREIVNNYSLAQLETNYSSAQLETNFLEWKSKLLKFPRTTDIEEYQFDIEIFRQSKLSKSHFSSSINNPFRILGLKHDATDKEIAKRVSDLLVYAEMGKKPKYETDLFFGEINRTIENIRDSAKKLENPNQKLYYTLLWFIELNELDKTFLNYLRILDRGEDSSEFNGKFIYLSAKFLEEKTNYFDAANSIYEEMFLNAISNINAYFNSTYESEKICFCLHDDIIPFIPLNIDSKRIENHLVLNSNTDTGFWLLKEITFDYTADYEIEFDCEWLEGEDVNKLYSIVFAKDSENNYYRFGISANGNLFFDAVVNGKYQNLYGWQRVDNLNIKSKNCLRITYDSDKNEFSFYVNDKYFAERGRFFGVKALVNPIKGNFIGISVFGKQKVTFSNFRMSYTHRISKEDTQTKIRTSNISSLINLVTANLCVCSFIEKEFYYKFPLTITLFGKIVNCDAFHSYATKIIGEHTNIDIKALEKYFIDDIYSFVKPQFNKEEGVKLIEFLDAFYSFSNINQNYIVHKFIGRPILEIENSIKKTKDFLKNTPLQGLILGFNLYNTTNEDLITVRKILTYTNYQYRLLANNLSDTLLDCGIVYFNSTQNNREIMLSEGNQILELVNHANTIAIDGNTRKRVDENMAFFEKWVSDAQKKEQEKFKQEQNKQYQEREKLRKEQEAHKQEQYRQEQERERLRKEQELKRNKTKSSFNQTINIPINKPNIGKQIFQKLRKIAPIYFWYILFVIIILCVFLIPDNKKDLSSNNVITKDSQPIKKSNESYTPVKNKSDLNVDLSNYKPRQQQAEVVEESKWKGNKLNNGDSPYNGYFGEGIYDYNSECYLIFKNGYSTDAIVCLENTATGRTIRNEYIRAGTDYKMTNIPEGIYKVKTFFGNDWNPEMTLNNGEINGAFDTDLNFSISDKPSDLIQMSITETGDGISYSTGEITLYTVSHGNMQQRNINSDEFFK